MSAGKRPGERTAGGTGRCAARVGGGPRHVVMQSALGRWATVVAGIAAAWGVCTLPGCDDGPQEVPWSAPRRPISAGSDRQRPAAGEAPAYDPEAVYEAVVTTSLGAFRMRLHGDKAPETVKRFIMLAADWRLYDGLTVFRVQPDVLIQTGDPSGTGLGDPGSGVPALKGEFNNVPFVAGTVAMARRLDNPNSAKGQWFVCLERRPDWDGKFAAFATVTEGLDVVRRISRLEVEGDRAIHPSRREQPVDPPVVTRVRIEKVSDAPGGNDRPAGAAEGFNGK